MYVSFVAVIGGATAVLMSSSMTNGGMGGSVNWDVLAHPKKADPNLAIVGAVAGAVLAKIYDNLLGPRRTDEPDKT